MYTVIEHDVVREICWLAAHMTLATLAASLCSSELNLIGYAPMALQLYRGGALSCGSGALVVQVA